MSNLEGKPYFVKNALILLTDQNFLGLKYNKLTLLSIFLSSFGHVRSKTFSENDVALGRIFNH